MSGQREMQTPTASVGVVQANETLTAGNEMKTRYFVIRSGNVKACQYADRVAAEQHAASIGGIVKELPFQPQYSKRVGVRGGQVRTKEFGVRHSDCSRKQADADGVKWFEVR